MGVSKLFKMAHTLDGIAFHLQRVVRHNILKGDFDNAAVGILEDVKVLNDLVFEIEQEWKRRKGEK